MNLELQRRIREAEQANRWLGRYLVLGPFAEQARCVLRALKGGPR